MNNNIVVIDSNFILLPFQFKIDYLNDIDKNLEGKTKFIVYQQIIDELKAKGKREPNATKFEMQLKSGLFYLEKFKEDYDLEFNHSTKEDFETTDDFLIRTCIDLKVESKHIFLATNDSELRKKARISGINIIYLRQKKFLSFE